jgi:hypothetical protein
MVTIKKGRLNYRCSEFVKESYFRGIYFKENLLLYIAK